MPQSVESSDRSSGQINADQLFDHFQNASREPVRLSCALEGYFSLHTPAAHRAVYRDHLVHHLRPALDRLASGRQAGRIARLHADGICSSQEIELLLHRWEDPAHPAQWLQLLSLKYASKSNLNRFNDPYRINGLDCLGNPDLVCTSPGNDLKPSDSSPGMSSVKDISAADVLLRRCLWDLYAAFPFLDGVLGALSLKEQAGSLPESLPVGTDGQFLFFNSESVTALWQKDPSALRRAVFHLILHCLLGHLWQKPVLPGLMDPPADLRHAAADLYVEFLIEQNCRKFSSLRTLLGSLPLPGDWVSLFSAMSDGIWKPERIAREVPKKTLRMLAPEMRQDDHSFWPSSAALSDGTDSTLRSQWRTIARDALWQENGQDASDPPGQERSSPAGKPGSGSPGGAFPGASGFGIGSFPGDECLPAGVIARGTYDYRSFLHRFSVFREEMQIDPDSFDQIYYTLGMERYGSLPLIEPLEYREGFRLEELVIAIDTSGSCKTPTVLRFLEETRSILEEKENFFPHMNVWILQCDCLVQSAVHIRSREDWDDYLRTLKISGRSGTDFRPVFRYVDDLRQKGMLSGLKALIYFTDGDGVYPREAPDYETAFVFVEEPAEGLHTPAWARKLVISGPPL